MVVALLDALAVAQPSCEARHVAVERRDAAAVLEDHDAAIAALGADEADAAVAGRLDDRAGRRRVVDALVRADRVEDRMAAARIEVRADAREVERRAQELPAHAATVGREVVGDLAVGGFEVDGAMHRAVVDEIRREDAAVADVLAVAILLFVDQVEAVAGLDVEREIDVPAEDVVGEPQDDFGADAGGAGRDEQRGIDRAVRAALSRISTGVAIDLGREAASSLARDREHFGLADAAAQRLHQAFVVHQRDRVAWPQPIQLLLARPADRGCWPGRSGSA